ncbi:MAG TPA: hypothetical protein VKR38_10750 [Usitatibacter sp.]|nr:hypothetical protein [Usitatibacter sp.]
MSKSHQRAVELLSEKIALGTRHRRWLYAALAFAWATGALWVFAHFALTANADGESLRHPLEAWSLKLHGAAAFAFLVALGSMFAQHIPRAWYLRRNVASGIATLALAAFLVATGYALYYFALDDAHAIVSTLHWTVGLAAIALFWIHVAMGRRDSGRAA